MYDKNLDLKTSQEWLNFTTTGTCDKNLVRPIIYESWLRSKDFGADPNKVVEIFLTEKDLNKRIDNRSDLLKVALPYINNIYSFVKNSGFSVYLTDEDGYILYLVGDSEFNESFNNVSKIRVGANRSEKFSGTNAIGTSMAIDMPIQIYGSEHYVRYHQSYTCSAAPIHNEENKIIGCLDITGKVDDVHSHTLGMIVAAVDGIEKELKINNAYNKIHIINSQLETTINSINTEIIVVSNDGSILNINNSALNTFKLQLCCIGEKINDVLDYNSKLINLEKLDKNYIDTELEVQNKIFSITTATYKNKLDQSVGSVISFREMKRIHKMVNKYSGFKATFTINNILGNSSQISYVKNFCIKASKSNSNVLILGESGTGKEIVAQSIHNASSRQNEPFIAINCGALPKGLIESELFGYEGGSFTGASREGKPGKFELADGGTIFLDEIGDMPLDIQVSLLRVLQNKEIIRIGGSKPKSVDVRIIAATNKDLFKSIKDKTFREDLYFRLNVLTINIPPLRERKSDIKILSDHFISYYNSTLNKSVSNIESKAYEALNTYSWPGNVRELENILERAINIVETDTITLEDLPVVIKSLTDTNSFQNINIINTSIFSESSLLNSKTIDNDLTDKKDNFEKDEIITALSNYKGNVVKSAESLAISRRTLYRKIKKFNIPVDSYR